MIFTKKKLWAKLLFVLACVLIFDSIGTVAAIGPRGLLSYLEWTAGCIYLVVFFMANWDLITKRK